MLKHAVVKDRGTFIGRYAVKYAPFQGNIEIKTVAGTALPLKYLMDVVTEVVEWYINRADEAHKARQYPWRVRNRKGRSGCLDFWVEELVDPEYGIINKRNRLHISMYNKLNRGLNINIADLTAILDSPDFPDDWFTHDDSGVEVFVSTPDLVGFNPPGTNYKGEEV